MQVKSHVKAGTGGTGGGSNLNHNEAQVRAAGLKVQTDVKAGAATRTPIGSGGSPG